MNPHWYETFFHGAACDLWRRAVKPDQTQGEADCLERLLNVSDAKSSGAGSARLLDVPCGNGRHGIELAKRGHAVTGIDISKEFIDEAKAAAEQAGLSAKGGSSKFLLGDMREISRLCGPSTQFDGAFCWGNAFGYMDHDGNVTFLRAVSAALRPGGRFALQIGTAAESLFPNYQPRMWYELGDLLFVVDNSYNVETSRLETRMTFIRDGKTDTRETSQAVYTVAELRRMFADAGLTPLDAYADVKLTPYAIGSKYLILVGEKSR